MVVGGTIAYWRLNRYVHTQLVPQVEASLLNLLDRPVEMGGVQGFSPIGIRFGPSVLPPTPEDRDQGQVDAVHVRFNPLDILLKKQLNLTLTLVSPELFIDQDHTGTWLYTQLQPVEPGPIQINLSHIALKNGTVALFPHIPQESGGEVGSTLAGAPDRFIVHDSPLQGVTLPSSEWFKTLDEPPVQFQKVSGSVQLRDENQIIDVDIKSKLQDPTQRQGRRLLNASGAIHVEGVVNTTTDDAPLFLGVLDTQRLPLTAIAPLVQSYLPPQVGTVTDGFLHSDVRIRVTGPTNNRPSSAFTPALTLWGDARIGDMAIQLPSLPNPLRQIKGQFVFKGERITLKSMRARYGDIRAIASGRLHLNDGYDLVATIPSVSLPQILASTEQDLPIETKGTFQSELKITGDLDNPEIAGTVTNKGTVLIDSLRLNQIQSRLKATLETIDINTLEAIPAVGGRLSGSGQVSLGDRPTLDLSLVAQELPGDKLLRQVLSQRLEEWFPDQTVDELLNWQNPATDTPDAPIRLGAIDSDIRITGPFSRLRTTAQIDAPQATFPTQGTLTFANQILSLEDWSTQFADGKAITTAAIDLNQQRWQGQVDLEQLALSQFPLNQIPWEQLPLDTIPPNPLISSAGIDPSSGKLDPRFTGSLDGTVNGSGRFDAFTPEAIALNGDLQLSNTPLLNTPLSTTFQWSGNQLQLDALETPILNAQGRIEVPFNGWVPTLGPFDLALTLQQLDLAQWALPAPESLTVTGLTDFEGRVFGTLDRPRVDGLMAFEGLTVNQIQFEPVAGPVQFSRDQGLAIDLRGNRDRIAATIDSTLRPVNFDLTHSLTAQTTTRIHGERTPNNPNLLLAEVEQFPLAALNLNPVSQLGSVGGILNSTVAINLANWDWQQANPLDTVAIEGNVAIAQPQLGYLGAECFQGNVRLANGVADLENGQLRLKRYTSSPADLSLPSACNQPLAINEGRYILNGRVAATPTLAFKGEIEVEQGHIQEWLRTLQFFDLEDLGRGLRPAPQYQAEEVRPFALPFARGHSSLRADSSSLQGTPRQGSANALPSNTNLLRQLQRYAEILALQDQKNRQQEQEFSLPQLQDLDGAFAGTIDVVATADAGLTADFALTGNDWTWGPYQSANQLTAIGEFANGTLTFLPLRFQSGDSRLNFAGSVGWGDDATGQFQATNVSVAWLRQFFKLPLNIDGNLNATAAITGNLQNPQARGNISLSDARLNREPIESATAQFTYRNARLGLLGDMQLQSSAPPAEASAELSEEPSAENGNTPASNPPADKLISLRGSLPYRLPQATVEPDRDDIDLNIALKDDGIGLLNLLNEHFFWEEGNGSITLDVGGTLRQTDEGLDFRPTIDGTAIVDEATFTAKVLPAPLTNVSGDIRFDGDRITVNTVEGRFSDGDFRAAGVIPLLNPFTPEELAVLLPNSLAEPTPNASDDGLPITTPSSEDQPRLPSQRLLALSLNDLEMNLKGLYNGGVDGLIDVRGTALAPELGGGIVLSNGRISLPDPEATAAAEAVAQEEEDNAWAGLITTPELTNLQVTLGRDLLITRLPILNFVATGNLNVNGPLQTDMSAIAPDGIITLHSGQVNLFTTQLNLDRSHNNTAIFRPELGSDPLLDVQLETSVLEDNRRRQPVATNLSQSEVADTSIGDLTQLQSIRIQAAVKGPASQLFNSIELTSSPSRSETEIVALMGGGFVDTLGRSEGFIGIANLAGTALFTSLQTLVSNAIGFSDFRIFPTVITDEDREEEGGGDVQTTSTLALAAELGVRLTNELSVSALQLLTVEEPTQYNLRYQLDDEILLRGSTNFSDDNRIVVEFETRF